MCCDRPSSVSGEANSVLLLYSRNASKDSLSASQVPCKVQYCFGRGLKVKVDLATTCTAVIIIVRNHHIGRYRWSRGDGQGFTETGFESLDRFGHQKYRYSNHCFKPIGWPGIDRYIFGQSSRRFDENQVSIGVV